MKIAINIGGQFGGGMTGVQHYVDSLLLALLQTDTPHSITAFVPQVWSPTLWTDAQARGDFAWAAHPAARTDTARTNWYLPPFVPLAPTVNRKLLHPLRARSTRLTEALARRAASRYDVLHTPGMSRPHDATYRARRNVCTVYDMTTRTHEWAHAPANIAAAENLFQYAKTCDRVLTISHYSKQMLCELLCIDPDRVDVAPLAPRAGTASITNLDEQNALLAPFNLHGNAPFALYAGTLEPRKNLSRLLGAWANVRTQTPALHAHRLVLAGGAWPGEHEKLHAQAAELGIVDAVVFTGYVSNAVLNALMAACAAFVYVSEAEGFGLPPLEAMACGAPVVASNTTSLPEVCGDAALCVDPSDTDAIASALHCLLTDARENVRLRALSVRRAALFSWDRAAQLTLQCYERAAA